VPGTVRCWRVKDAAGAGPFRAECACGWWMRGMPSQRMAKRQWHRHIGRVRVSVENMQAAA
jgi:hypothetical protein